VIPASTELPQSEITPADDFNAGLQARVEAANDLDVLVSELERVVERQRFKSICGPKIWKQMDRVQEMRANGEEGQEKAIEKLGDLVEEKWAR
jgi:hypothetical protein